MAQMPDNLTVAVPNSTATGGPAVGAFGYDPTADTLWVAGYGASAWIRKVMNVTENPSYEEMVSPSEWARFTKTNPDFSGGMPICGGLSLNPLTIYDVDGVTPLYPPYSQAWIADANSLVKDPTNRFDLTKRIYRYNLQVPSGGHAGTVMTPVVTLEQMANTIGLDPPGTVSNIGRKFAWSSDGQSIYFNDSSSAYGGIWKVRVATGALSRIFRDDAPGPAVRVETEPCVVHTSVRDLDPLNPAEGDQILFRGSTASGNVGGLDYLIDTGTSILGPYALYTEAQLERFIQWNGRYLGRPAAADGADPGTDPDERVSIASIEILGTDLYLHEAVNDSVWRLDSQGRMAAVVTKPQRVKFNEANGATSNILQAGMLRLQFFRQAPFAHFTVPEFLFQDPCKKLVGGLLAFQTGDFNRDGEVDEADRELFKAMALTPIRTLYDAKARLYYEAPVDEDGNDLIADGPAYVEYLKYDLNGNGLVTARDRFILWKFMYPGKSPCDFDLDGDVDQDDFGHLQVCISGSDHAVSDPDCYDALLDEDQDVDQEDVDVFVSCRTGPAIPPAGDCPF